jgi:hypothetical protein
LFGFSYLEVMQNTVQSAADTRVVQPRGWRLSHSDYEAKKKKEREKFARCRAFAKAATLPSVCTSPVCTTICDNELFPS